jgi:glycosyltransferase involved in cell wall biosynthesis
MTAPTISVLITSYDYGRFIEECIDSVLAQEYPTGRVEIVVVDDGSTDDTAERVRKYGSKINYIRKTNGGQASALNVGFTKSSGEIISLLDADDYFLPGKLLRVADAFQADPELGMFYHPFAEFDMETNKRSVSQFPLISGSAFSNPERFGCYGGPGTCVSFRRKFVERLLPIPEEIRMLADGYLGSMIVFVAPILAAPDCLAAYRFHGKNAYYVEKIEPEARKKRLNLYHTEFAAMRRWLAENACKKSQLPVRIFFAYWHRVLNEQQFAIEAPGRFRYLRYLVGENYREAYRQTTKLTILKYVTCLAALAFGYEKRDQMEQWRAGVAVGAGRLLRRSSGTHTGTGLSGGAKA